AIFDRTPVQHDMVPDRHVAADDQRVGIVRHVQHTEILHVRPLAQTDVVDITADHGVEPYAALLAHHDVTDHNARVFDEAGLGNGRGDALKGSDHRLHDRGIDLVPARGSLTAFSG